MRVLIVGCGYVGRPLGAELARQGHEVFGMRRSTLADAELQAAGITPVHADITEPATLATLPPNLDWVVNCAASGGGGPDEYRQLYLHGNRHLLEHLAAAPPRMFVYTSSTGVYGQNDGSLVTESSTTEPDSETAKVLVQAEQMLLGAARTQTFPAVILRVAGIYGPERGYLLKQFLRHEARIEGHGGRYLNMIHRDDLIGVILAALRNGRPGEVYNAVDDQPVSQLEFFTWLAAKLNRALPPTVPEDSTAPRKRGLTNKRISNQKLRTDLGYGFKHPNYQSGYSAEIQRLDVSGR
ncbi:MAG: SDR family oxidoreductase [Verrucomicrobiae bacterium]|nr:SDR family oxidoreductase [Verrucomicrobiae bacterium]